MRKSALWASMMAVQTACSGMVVGDLDNPIFLAPGTLFDSPGRDAGNLTPYAPDAGSFKSGPNPQMPDAGSNKCGSDGCVLPIGPGWTPGQICRKELNACVPHKNPTGGMDPNVPNPCPDNCVRSNHDCSWTCRPRCEVNPDACGQDPCAAEGHGVCAAGICWRFSRCECVRQGFCESCPTTCKNY